MAGKIWSLDRYPSDLPDDDCTVVVACDRYLLTFHGSVFCVLAWLITPTSRDLTRSSGSPVITRCSGDYGCRQVICM